MARSTKKPVFIAHSLLRKLQKSEQTNAPIKTYSRRSTIISLMLGKTIFVHNGKVFLPVHISEDKIGHKLGEFALTRTFKKHSGDKQAQRRIS